MMLSLWQIINSLKTDCLWRKKSPHLMCTYYVSNAKFYLFYLQLSQQHCTVSIIFAHEKKRDLGCYLLKDSQQISLYSHHLEKCLWHTYHLVKIFPLSRLILFDYICYQCPLLRQSIYHQGSPSSSVAAVYVWFSCMTMPSSLPLLW